MEIIGVENFDTDENIIEVLFDGLFKEGFTVKTEFDFEVEVIQEEELRVGCKEIKVATDITFWEFKMFNAEEEEITINDKEEKRIKQLVEFKLIDLLDDEINNY
jgi:hypothetical protein